MRYLKTEELNFKVSSFIDFFRKNTHTENEIIFSVDKDLQLVSFNDQYKLFHKKNYPQNISLGKCPPIIDVETESGKALWGYCQKAMNGETIHLSSVEENISIEILITPVTEEDDNVKGLFFVCRDISDKYEISKKLQAGEEKYLKVIDSVNDIIFQTDAVGNWSFLNKSWERVMEYTVEECIGKPFFNYLFPEDIARNQELFAPLINGIKAYCNHEIRYVTKSGTIKWVNVYAVLLKDDSGNIIGTSGTLQDINQQKRSTDLLNLVSNNIKDFIVFMDTNGKPIFQTPSAKNYIGYDVDNYLSQSFTKLFYKNQFKDFYHHFSELINGTKQESDFLEYQLLFNDGKYHWIELKMSSVFDHNNKIFGVLASARLIEERKEAEAKMLQALVKEKQVSEMKSKFLSLASHEVKNPLTAIKSSSEIITLYLKKLKMESSYVLLTHLDVINREVGRLEADIHDILLIGKIESDIVIVDKTQIELEPLIEEAIKRIRLITRDERVIQFHVNGRPRLICVNEMKFFQMVENLLTNAVKYSVNKAAPEIQVTYFDDEFELNIIDHGIGIPEKDLERLFTPFYRASNVKGFSGTGLGLVIVKKFIELHNGTISVNSTEGEGTSVIVRIPYKQ